MSPHGDSCDLPGERALGHRYGRIGAAIAVGGLLASMLGAEPAAAADPPTDVVLDVDSTARDFTLWIVALKLLLGGAVLLVAGLWRLRRARHATGG